MNATEIVIDSVRGMAEAFLAQLPNLIIAVVVLFFAWMVDRAVGKGINSIFARVRLRETLVDLFGKLISIAIWITAFLIAAMIIFPDFTPGKLLTILGLGSIAIGFAFKDIFENFLAGILILIREPFQLGDLIQVEDMEGFVEEVTIRDTSIRKVDGQLIVIPNAKLFTNPVTVRTNRKERRITVMCGVGYGEDVDEAREIIRAAVEGVEGVNSNRDVQIFAQSFGASSIDYEVTWWTGSSPLDIRKSRDKVVSAVKRALDDAGIEIPFPYRTLTFGEPLKTISRVTGSEDDGDFYESENDSGSGQETHEKTQERAAE